MPTISAPRTINVTTLNATRRVHQLGMETGAITAPAVALEAHQAPGFVVLTVLRILAYLVIHHAQYHLSVRPASIASGMDATEEDRMRAPYVLLESTLQLKVISPLSAITHSHISPKDGRQSDE